MIIRHAVEADLIHINDIYNFYVENAFSTFDTVPCSIDTRREWFAKYSATSPHQLIVAVEGEAISGWVCTSKYREHISFAATAEVTAYIHPDHRAKGIASELYTELFKSIEGHRLHRLVAGIALPNDSSIRLHKKFGFNEIGVFDEYAQKNGKFISSVWLQKKLL